MADEYNIKITREQLSDATWGSIHDLFKLLEIIQKQAKEQGWSGNP